MKQKPRKKRIRIIISLSVLLLTGVMLSYFFLDLWQERYYDLNHDNEYVSNIKDVDEVLSAFETVSLKDLPHDYRETAGLNDPKFLKMVHGMKFYVLTKKDCNRKIVGNQRIKQIMSRDLAYQSAHYFSDKKLYLGIDKRVLFRLVNLRDRIAKKGLNSDALFVKSGHRTPSYNKLIGGASRSRHIVGEALDLRVGDINQDGVFTQADKKIVLDLCENVVIRNWGGIGLYPNTDVVHIDVRGYRARWNSY